MFTVLAADKTAPVTAPLVQRDEYFVEKSGLGADCLSRRVANEEMKGGQKSALFSRGLRRPRRGRRR
jgi:hypothetical protein